MFCFWKCEWDRILTATFQYSVITHYNVTASFDLNLLLYSLATVVFNILHWMKPGLCEKISHRFSVASAFVNILSVFECRKPKCLWIRKIFLCIWVAWPLSVCMMCVCVCVCLWSEAQTYCISVSMGTVDLRIYFLRDPFTSGEMAASLPIILREVASSHKFHQRNDVEKDSSWCVEMNSGGVQRLTLSSSVGLRQWLHVTDGIRAIIEPGITGSDGSSQTNKAKKTMSFTFDE